MCLIYFIKLIPDLVNILFWDLISCIEYRNSNSANEQSLLEVMDVCKTLVEIYDDVYDDLDFDDYGY